MNVDPFFQRFLRAGKVRLSQVPEDLQSRARLLPKGKPLAAPYDAGESDASSPEDIRGGAISEIPAGEMITRKLPGLDVTLMVVPPEGDELWLLRGCLWLTEPSSEPVRIALVRGENVMSLAQVQDGGDFEIREVLRDGWCLEFHLPNGSIAVLQS